ncbi:MAG: sulfatase-like hydrolase/transferase [Bryobacteraceae bacterium]
MITRRAFLGASALAAGVQAQARRPNIVMILCDDLGYGDLGCFGNRIIQTPNLDRLAAQGVRFTGFYAASTVCTPTRAALMTGHHPQRYGIHHADLPESLPRYPLPSSAVTIAEVLRGAGYYTAHVGKWHLGEPPETVTPREQGFDHFFGCFGGRPSSPWIKFARSMNPEIVVNENRPVVYKGHVTDVQTAAALEVLDGAPRDRPFFLNLWYNAPHEPLVALDHQAKLYRDWSAEEQTYFQTVTDMDAGVGRVLAKLEQLGAAQNTLILFCSDNGPEVHRNRFSRGSAGPLKGMKTQLWEGGIRVPGILNWPGRAPSGIVSLAPVSVLDVFPTFCAAAGIPVPANVKLDGGADLVSISRGARDVTGRSLFFEFHFPQRGVASSLPMVVRRGRWKLFATHDLARVELYDLSADAGETRDVAAQNQNVVHALRSELKKWWSQFEGKVDLGLKPTRVAVPSEEELEKRHYRN